MNTIPKARLDKLIPMAQEVISSVGIAQNNEVPKSFHGYISSFGADMVQTSPLAAAIFFQQDEPKNKEEGEEETSDSEKRTLEKRYLIPKAILQLMRKEKAIGEKYEKLSQYIIDKSSDGIIPNSVVYDIIAAAIALKIALRTFKIKKKDGEAQ